MATPFQADYNRYVEGSSCIEMIEQVQRWLGVAAGDYVRYPKADIVKALNAAGLLFAKKTSCLTYPAIIVCAANQQNYPLPFGTLRVLTADYYTSSSRTAYDHLQILKDAKEMRLRDGEYRGTLGTPEYLFPSYRAGSVMMIGVSPIPTVNGTTYASSVSSGILSAATGFAMAGDLSGTHKTGYASSAFLVDADGRNFMNLGARPGFPVFNTTTETSGIITSIENQDATYDKIVAELTGGALWEVGDAFTLSVSDFGVVLDATGEEPAQIMTSSIGTVAEILDRTNNIVLDIARKPLAFSVTLDDQISEIPESYQDAQVGYAVYLLGRGAYKGLVQAEKAKEGLAIFDQLVLDFTGDDQDVDVSERAVTYHDIY